MAGNGRQVRRASALDDTKSRTEKRSRYPSQGPDSGHSHTGLHSQPGLPGQPGARVPTNVARHNDWAGRSPAAGQGHRRSPGTRYAPCTVPSGPGLWPCRARGRTGAGGALRTCGPSAGMSAPCRPAVSFRQGRHAPGPASPGGTARRTHPGADGELDRRLGNSDQGSRRRGGGMHHRGTEPGPAKPRPERPEPDGTGRDACLVPRRPVRGHVSTADPRGRTRRRAGGRRGTLTVPHDVIELWPATAIRVPATRRPPAEAPVSPHAPRSECNRGLPGWAPAAEAALCCLVGAAPGTVELLRLANAALPRGEARRPPRNAPPCSTAGGLAPADAGLAVLGRRPARPGRAVVRMPDTGYQAAWQRGGFSALSRQPAALSDVREDALARAASRSHAKPSWWSPSKPP